MIKDHWHKFGKWSKPFNSTTTRATGEFGDWREVSIVQQTRVCEVCDYVQSREVRDGKVEDQKQ